MWGEPTVSHFYIFPAMCLKLANDTVTISQLRFLFNSDVGIWATSVEPLARVLTVPHLVPNLSFCPHSWTSYLLRFFLSSKCLPCVCPDSLMERLRKAVLGPVDVNSCLNFPLYSFPPPHIIGAVISEPTPLLGGTDFNSWSCNLVTAVLPQHDTHNSKIY